MAYLQTRFENGEKYDVFETVTFLVNQKDRERDEPHFVLPGSRWKNSGSHAHSQELDLPDANYFNDGFFILRISPKPLTDGFSEETVFKTRYTYSNYEFDKLHESVNTPSLEEVLQEIETSVMKLQKMTKIDGTSNGRDEKMYIPPVVYKSHPSKSTGGEREKILLDAYECFTKIDPYRVMCGIKLSPLEGYKPNQSTAVQTFAARVLIATMVEKKLASTCSKMAWCFESISFSPGLQGMTVIVDAFNNNLVGVVQKMAHYLEDILEGFEDTKKEWIRKNLKATRDQLIDGIKSKKQCQPYSQWFFG